MKKLIIGLCVVLLLIGLIVGYNLCFNQTDEPDKNTVQNHNQSTDPNDAQKPAEGPKDYSEIGLALLANESLAFLKGGLSDADVVGLLGEADEKSKDAVWGADGEKHQTWYYHFKGIELDMIQEGDGQMINMITITGPCEFKTLRGIGIGSFKGEVLTAYEYEIDPETVGRDRSVLIAGNEFGGVIFHFKNNRVSSIFIGAAAE